MQKISFNDNWQVSHLGMDDKRPVTLPHDAMLEEPRIDSPYGHNNGFFAGCDYLYEKEFSLPADLAGKHLCLEFEGIYHNSSVFLNGTEIASEPNGYLSIYADITGLVQERNTLSVIVRNSDQPNSRWYTGSGIYRPVWLWYADKAQRLEQNDVRITTLSHDPAQVEIRVKTIGTGEVALTIADEGTPIWEERKAASVADDRASTGKQTAGEAVDQGSTGKQAAGEAVDQGSTGKQAAGEAVFTVTIPNAKLWSADSPHLYTACLTFGTDHEEIPFGVRSLKLDLEKGFLVNGKREILRGACIHGDNGLLGVKEYDFAAERKVRLLKEAGYNALRSAHNPASKSFLKACDKLGMYVLDEYTDMWYIHKNKYDDASRVPTSYRRDIEALTTKDYNHPCVVMYSSGNEVSETSQARGIAFTKELTECFHAFDPTRPVTAGINIFFNFLASIGMGFYSDEKADAAGKDSDKAKSNAADNDAKGKNADQAKSAANDNGTAGKTADGKVKKQKAVGSEFFNNLAGTFGSDTMKVMAWFPFCDWATKKAFANMDIAGYNYGNTRYKKDLKKYPNRFILGAETFITDAADFVKVAENNPRILGDFAWSGIDYIGEVALGSLDYADYAKDFEKTPDWLTAGCGCLDITGASQGHTAYTQVVYDKRDIAIAVQPADHSGEGHMTSAWRKIHAFESWSWNGCDGHQALVEVYTKAPKVQLYVNGKLVSTGVSKHYRFQFRIPYEAGEITAVACAEDGRELARTSLRTAGDETRLAAIPEKETIAPDEFAYVRLRYTDTAGERKPLARGDIHVSVEGGTLLALGSACPYNERGYLVDTTDTYYGEALAIIKPDGKEIRLRAESPYGSCERRISVVG